MTTEIKVYDPFRAQLAEMKQANASLIFDYNDPEGNKAARSHVYKLRLSKGAIEQARKDEKAASLEYGRKVDAEAKALTAEIEEMIAVHQSRIDEIEQQEKKRTEAITQKIGQFIMVGQNIELLTADALRERIDKIGGEPTEEEYQEFFGVATKERATALERLTATLEAAEKRERDAAELEALRKEKEEREKAEREAQAKRDEEKRIEDAKEQAREEERQRQEKENEEQAKREQELKDRAERAEKDAQEAAQKAADDERKRIEKEQADKDAEDRRRAADRDHKIKIHGAIIEALDKLGVSEELAKGFITAIARGEIPHVIIKY